MSLFIEKYRPKVREEIVGNKEELDKIFAVVKTGNIPHMIFKGQPGVGKTTTALVIARQLFGEFYKANFLELNASDDRGIDVVRGEIKMFCKTSPLNSTFKIIFLSEADNMTKDAQQALRRIMEQYGNVTRFILDCNNPEKLIEPIKSRCEEFHFAPLRPEDIQTRVQFIVEQEKIQITPDALQYLCEQAEGDMRKALNKLQVLASLGTLIDKKVINIQTQKEQSFGIINSLSNGRFLEARKQVKELLFRGFTERDIVDDLHKLYIGDTLSNISPQKKGECILELSETDFRFTQYVNKSLQMDSLLLKLIKIMKV